MYQSKVTQTIIEVVISGYLGYKTICSTNSNPDTIAQNNQFAYFVMIR